MAEADRIIQACNTLRQSWTVRNQKMLDWYNLLLLEDTLKQQGMESVISNDPRTGFNLALHLLTSSNIAHRIPVEGLATAQIGKASYLEGWVTKQWVGLNEAYRRRGHQGWLRYMVSLMLSTGWFSIFSMVTDDSIIAEIWHPATVFQEFGDDLLQVAHIYTMSPMAANRRMRLMGWQGRPFPANFGPVTDYDWWTYDDDGDVVNAVVLGDRVVKPATKVTETCGRIPVFTGPVSGLPETGVLMTGGGSSNEWQKHYGEAIVATNEDLQANYNKMLTFTQQMVRDTANARWLELSSGGESGILSEENLFKRGAIFRGAPGETVTPLPVPPIPVELRTIMFDYQNMLQRGMFPWVLYGNLQMQLTGVAMSQIASAALQVLTPYQMAVKGVLSDINNFWLQQMKENGYRPHKFIMPTEFEDIPPFDVDFNIDIPGFLVQRATAARMLDPNFRLSTTTVMDMLFPEVKNPLQEQARVQKDEADRNHISLLIAMIQSYREAARMARDGGDTQSAELYDQAVAALQAQMKMLVPQPQGQTEQVGGRQRAPVNVAEQELPATQSLGSQPPEGGI